jgi:hypothetical protein
MTNFILGVIFGLIIGGGLGYVLGHVFGTNALTALRADFDKFKQDVAALKK